MISNRYPTDFTDEELKRLRIAVESNPHEDDDGLSIRGTKRLLLRLDAAESALEEAQCGHTFLDHDLAPCEFSAAMLNWRRIAGKLA